MSNQADLYAVGPYSEDIVQYLNYPPEFYKDVKQGEDIFTVVCGMNTTSGSNELAEALGVDTWSFGQHIITSDKVDIGKFAKIMQDCKDVDFDLDDVLATINALKGKGFLFIYHPNG